MLRKHVAIRVILLLAALTVFWVTIGRPKFKLSLPRHVTAFPQDILKVDAVTLTPGKLATVAAIEGFAPLAFLGNTPVSLDLLIKGAQSFVSFKGLVSSGEGDADHLVFRNKGKSRTPPFFMLSRAGELFFGKGKSTGGKVIGTFSPEYFTDPTLFKKFAKTAGKIAIVAKDGSVAVDPDRLADLKLAKISIAFFERTRKRGVYGAAYKKVTELALMSPASAKPAEQAGAMPVAGSAASSSAVSSSAASSVSSAAATSSSLSSSSATSSSVPLVTSEIVSETTTEVGTTEVATTEVWTTEVETTEVPTETDTTDVTTDVSSSSSSDECHGYNYAMIQPSDLGAAFSVPLGKVCDPNPKTAALEAPADSQKKQLEAKCAEIIRQKLKDNQKWTPKYSGTIGFCGCPSPKTGCTNADGGSAFRVDITVGSSLMDAKGCTTYSCTFNPQSANPDKSVMWNCKGSCTDCSSSSSSEPETTEVTTEVTTEPETTVVETTSAPTDPTPEPGTTDAGTTEVATSEVVTTEVFTAPETTLSPTEVTTDSPSSGDEVTTEVTTEITTEVETTESTEPETTKISPTCYLCIWDVADTVMTKGVCDRHAQEARQAGMNPVVVISNEEAIIDQKQLCTCDNIEVLRAAHGDPGGEFVPFVLAEELVAVAPGCSTMNINDLGCSRFDSSNRALTEAKKLGKWMAASGYAGTVTINGNQTITIAEGDPSPLIYRVRFFLSTGLTVDAYKQKMFCSINTPLSFEVCAKDVRIGYSPCKSEGGISQVSRDGGDKTIVCELGGKRANQFCTYVNNNSCECGDRKCHYCDCKWGKAEVCTN